MTRRILLGVALVLGLAGIYALLAASGWLDILGDEAALRRRVAQWGAWGPVALALLLATAIVVSPVPSAPIALVAGAAYGPLLGSAVTVAGAEGGALVAFLLARHLGYDAVRRWARVRPVLERLEKKRSQTWLMGLVFLSRLLPFVSFDAVSYAAGLTPLAFWRFAVATAAGVVPVSVALVYLGDEMMSLGAGTTLAASLVVGGVTLVPLAIHWYRRRR